MGAPNKGRADNRKIVAVSDREACLTEQLTARLWLDTRAFAYRFI